MAKKVKNLPMKIVKYGLQNRVFEEMKKPDFSAEKLAKQFKDEDKYVSAQSIRKFIRNSKKAQGELIQKDLRTAHELTKVIQDYGTYLKVIIDEVEEVKTTAKDSNDYATYNQMVDKLYKGVELIAKLTGDIKPAGSIDINIIYNEIKDDVETQTKNMKTKMFKDTVIDIDYEITKEDERQAKTLVE